MSKTIVYLRVSTDKQETSNQRFEVENWVKKRGFEVTEWIEETMSGTKEVKDRKIGPILDRLEKEDVLIVTEISRISRNLYHIMEVLKRCLEQGIVIYTVKEGFVLGNDINSKILAFAFGLAAEIERNLISQRTKEALARKKAEGVILGRPVGAQTGMRKLDDQAEEVQRLLDCGLSYSAIGKVVGAHRLTVVKFIKDRDMLSEEQKVKRTQKGESKIETSHSSKFHLLSSQYANIKEDIKTPIGLGELATKYGVGNTAMRTFLVRSELYEEYILSYSTHRARHVSNRMRKLNNQ